MERQHFVYLLTSPSGRQYAGVTSMALLKRWQAHLCTARKGDPRPLYAAIRKYGVDSFKVDTVAVYPSAAEAYTAEIKLIASLEHGYNISPGGENDALAATAAFKEKCKDPDWYADYISKLKAGIAASQFHNTPEMLAAKTAALKNWQKANPKEAYRIQRRATRSAAAKATTTGENAAKRANKAPNKMQSIKRRKQAVKKVWAERTEDQRKEVSEKIAEGVAASYAGLDVETRRSREEQLAEARQKIDHTLRKKNQKKALAAYWTPERRAAHSLRMKARHANLRHN